MNNNLSKVSGSVCIITNLVILTLAVLELKDKIVKRRMKKEHVSPINPNGEEQVGQGWRNIYRNRRSCPCTSKGHQKA